jgi:hypothetical protein
MNYGVQPQVTTMMIRNGDIVNSPQVSARYNILKHMQELNNLLNGCYGTHFKVHAIKFIIVLFQV